MIKMIKILINIFFLTITTLSLGCDSSNTIYALGSASDLTGKTIPGYWKNETWIDIESPEQMDNCGTYTLSTDNETIIIGGYIRIEGRGWIPGYWQDGSWIELSLPENSSKGFINSVLIDNNEIYAAGSYYNELGNVVSGYWKNGEWISLSNHVTDNRILNSFLIRNDNIYWTGSYQAMSEFSDSPGYYINSEWIDLPIPQDMINGEVSFIKKIDSYIYFIGFCINKNDERIAGYWVNEKWTELKSTDDDTFSSIREMVNDQDDIYITVNKNGYLKNGEWIQLAPENENLFLNTIAVLNENVIVAGHRYENRRCYPGYWENNMWIELEEPMPENKFGDSVHSIIIVND